MIPIFQRIVSFAALTLLLVARSSHAADVAAWPAPTITSLAFAPDGQTLWSLNREGQLTVRGANDKSVRYSGVLPGRDDTTVFVVSSFARFNDGGLQVLKDGSFLWGTNWGILQWFEPPEMGQPLKLRREFKGVEFLREQDQPRGGIPGRLPDVLVQLRSGERAFGALAISPDETQVAYAYLVLSPDYASRRYATQALVRTWNLNGALGFERVIELSDFWNKVATDQHDETGNIAVTARPYLSPQLAWADNETLAIAHGRGLSLSFFSATTGTMRHEIRATNALEALTRAQALRATQSLQIAPAERETLVKNWRKRDFNPANQEILALSTDGKQLLVLDAVEGELLTLWNMETGEVRILNDAADFVPWKAKFSRDGTRVAAWNSQLVRSWRDKSEMSILTREGAPIQEIALGDEQIAIASGTDQIRSFAVGSALWGKRPVRLEDLKPMK